jgi:hypothetical protein
VLDPGEGTSSLDKEIQCPICCLKFPVHEIEEHADNCSTWLLESEQPAELYNTTEVEDEINSESAQTPSQIKTVLKEQIAGMVTGPLTELKRVNIRRKFMWQDFKAARQNKFEPNSNLKVVFVGEPYIDDGGPKRELFAGKRTCVVLGMTCYVCVACIAAHWAGEGKGEKRGGGVNTNPLLSFPFVLYWRCLCGKVGHLFLCKLAYKVWLCLIST